MLEHRRRKAQSKHVTCTKCTVDGDYAYAADNKAMNSHSVSILYQSAVH